MKYYLLFTLLIGVCFQATTQVPQAKTYKDIHGQSITLPLGDLSFADEVVSFEKGDPGPRDSNADPKAALGEPDHDGTLKGFVSLGCGGTLIVKFTDNALVNVDGPDLYVFEVGKNVEPTSLAISKDGRNWIEVGKINGGTVAVDIGDSVKTGEKFNYVKLTDLRSACEGQWPGADIDAVAAIGSGLQMSLKGAVLFANNKSELKAEAREELAKIAERLSAYPALSIIIEGHTDNTGPEQSNQALSLKRAEAVKAFLEQALKNQQISIRVYGYASRYPLVSNNTPEGREMNRRVELVAIPLSRH